MEKRKSIVTVNRETLQKIRDEAKHFVAETTEPWLSAYANLASAADYLDALFARTQADKKKE